MFALAALKIWRFDLFGKAGLAFWDSDVSGAFGGDDSGTDLAYGVVAFVFGLLHGFGFAGAMSEVGLPEQAIPLALLFFNVGVELGQLLFIAAAGVVVVVARRLAVPWPVWAWRVPAYGIGTVAAFWTIERVMGF